MGDTESTPTPTASNESVTSNETSLSLAQEHREALYKKSNELTLSAAAPAATAPVTDTDLKESESEDPAASGQSDSSSSVKEDVTKKQKPDAIKGDPNKALHEEREKRKEANRRLRDLQIQYDEKIKALEDRLNAIPVKSEKSEMPVGDGSLEQEVRLLREKIKSDEDAKKQDAQKELQATLQKKIQGATKALDDDGYPGFDLALAKVDAAVTKRVIDGDILKEEASDPAVWQRVYIEDVYPEVAARFGAIKKTKTLEDKIKAKQKASMIGNPGQSPNGLNDGEEAPAPTSEELGRAYLAHRNKTSPNNR